MKAILRAGTWELLARADVPVGAVITEYVDVAHAFYERREAGFVNGLLDGIARQARARAAATVQAAASRAAFGRTKAQKQADARERARHEATVDGARRED
ncbi:hypothetical protein LTR94_031703 [Friedmanniomyces endolithicus]|nr:hypothetical protein LTR94_031703 [Friedmanniomyces endolithicus]